MYKALIYKEWIKTRRVFALSMLVSLLFAVYVILNIKSAISNWGMSSIWLNMIQKDVSMVNVITYLPLVIGIAIGVAQMIPEMSHKRLKLTLHLPCSHLRLISIMLGTALVELLAIYILQLAFILCYDYTILPGVLVLRVMLTMLPWYLAGMCAYLFVASICLEGTWYMRVIIALIGVAVTMTMFKQQEAMGAYNCSMWLLVIITMLVAILSFGSVARFKEGLQD